MGRSFGRVSDNIDLSLFSSRIKEINRYHGYIAMKENRPFDIQVIDQGIFSGASVLAEREYIACLATVKLYVEKRSPVLDRDKNEIDVEKAMIEVVEKLPFWVQRDSVIFSRSTDARHFLIPYLQERIRTEINIPHYNVKRIYEDYKPGGRVCGFGFLDRPDAISSGSVYGDIDPTDPLITELDSTEKNFVCLRLNICGDEVSINVYRNGTIVIKKNWYEMGSYLPCLRKVTEFLRGYEEQENNGTLG